MAINETSVTTNATYRPKPDLYKEDEDGFKEDVNYKVSAITLDCALGSSGANAFIDSLLKL